MLPSSILPAVPTTLLTWTHTRVDPELFWFHQLENILSFFTSEVEFPFLKYLFDKLTHIHCDRFFALAVFNWNQHRLVQLYVSNFDFDFFLPWNISLQTHTWHIVSVTDTHAEKPISDLPGEDARALRLCFAKSYFPFCILQKNCFLRNISFFSSHLVFWDLFDHSWRGNPRFWATDLTGLDAAGLVVPATNNYNVERQWKLQGVTSAQGKFYLVLRRKFHQSLV